MRRVRYVLPAAGFDFVEVEIAMQRVIGTVLPRPDIHESTLRDRGLGKPHAKTTDTLFAAIHACPIAKFQRTS